MGCDWRTSTWGNEISLEYGKSLRGYRGTAGKFRVFGSNGPIGWTDMELALGPGVILGRKGAYRGVEFSKKPFFVIDTAYYVVPKTDLDMRWLYYAIKHYKLGEIDDGSPIPSTTRAAVYGRELEVPSLAEQTLIANALGVLDDRINLLRQTNTTLEAIAQALFKSWFVDFDPVHAKAEGRAPEAMDAATAALFPSEFEESELGLIPKGWRAGGLSDISNNQRDQAKPERIDPNTPYFGLEHMPRKSIALGDHGTADGLGSGKFWFEESDILFGKLRPYFHKVGIAPFKGICSTDILVLRPLKPAFHALLLTHASSDALINYATRLSNGAKMPRSSWKDLARYPICIPPDPVAQAFNDLIGTMFERIKENVQTSSTLSQLRDTLLPRLISGKLRLPEATEAAEAALV